MQNVNKINLNLLKLKPKQKVLDVGSSSGDQALRIASQGLSVTGLDISKSLINTLNKNAKKQKLNCKGIVGDIKKMPFKDKYFDSIIATEVLEHIPGPKKALKECFRVLKKNGTVCLSVPTNYTENIFKNLHPNWVKNSGHINVFSERDLISLVENAGFKIYRKEYHNFEWSIFWLIHSLLKTNFEDTGTTLENKKITDIYFRVWNYLYKLRIGNMVNNLGNKLFPKSIYLYLKK